MSLEWPPEIIWGEDDVESWFQPASNYVLDFHGDPLKAGLVDDGGDWGERFMAFMREETAADIYTRHGLVQRRDTQ
jgi:hypothetical protein